MKLQHENIAKINCMANESNECLNYVFFQINLLMLSMLANSVVVEFDIKMVDDRNLTKLISYYQQKNK